MAQLDGINLAMQTPMHVDISELAQLLEPLNQE